MQADRGTDQGWWLSGDALPRVLSDLIRAEARRLRPATAVPPSGAWAPDTRLGEAGLGFDSLERLHLAAVVSELLYMRDGGPGDDLLARPAFGEWCAIASDTLGRCSATLSFRTSGTLGAPKSCPHALLELEREIDAVVEILSGGPMRVLTAVPCHHIYGFLFTVLLPHRLGDVPVVDIRAESPGALPGLAAQGDLVVGYPEYWAAALRAAPWAWPAGITGVTSTAPCPEETADGLMAGKLSRLLQVHGSSETAGIGWRDDPRGPYSLLSYWDRGTDDRLIRARMPGTAAAPVAVMAPDRLEWLDRRRYRIGDRHDGAVQVGGVNVSTSKVCGVLQAHPDVAAVAVRLMTPTEGHRLKAFIVPKLAGTDGEVLRSRLDAWTATRLSVPEQPRAYTIGTVLPSDPMGKPADWTIIPYSL